jgi:hypothetical protein
VLIRVAEPGKPAFQLRPGEEGLSVFDADAVDPPLTETEVLDSFRSGSTAVLRSLVEVEVQGLEVVPIEGTGSLPQRLRDAHAEIRPGAGMARGQFKQALKQLE